MNRKVAMLCSIFVSVLGLTGCFPTQPRTDTETNTIIEENDELSELFNSDGPIEMNLGENIRLNIKEEIPKRGDVTDNMEVTIHQFNHEDVYNILMGDQALIEEQEIPNGTSLGYTDTMYTTEDGSSLMVSSARFNYSSKEDNSKGYATIISDYSNVYLSDEIEKDYGSEELKTGTIEEAKAVCEGKFAELGLEGLTEARIISLSTQELLSYNESLNDFIDMHKGEYFTEDDEAYVLIYSGSENGVEISPISYVETNEQGESSVVNGTRVLAIVSDNELIRLSVEGIYDVNQSSSQEERNADTLEMTLQRVEEKYNSLILGEPLIITDISLQYLPKHLSEDELIFKSYWILTCEQTETISDEKGTTTFTTVFPMIYSADTGEELKVEVF